MSPLPQPTSTAVAGAVAFFREQRELTCAELAYLLSRKGHELGLEAVLQMEQGEHAITVDDLVALAYVLDVTPNDLLGHVPIPPHAPAGGPIATGLPDDLAPGELGEWLGGQLALDDASRAAWWAEQEEKLEIQRIHFDDQLAAAIVELRELGELAEREVDAKPVQQLHARIRAGELAVHETGRELDVVGMRLDELRGPE